MKRASSAEVGLMKSATAMQRCVLFCLTLNKSDFWERTEKHRKLRELLHELAKQLVELTAPKEEVIKEAGVSSDSMLGKGIGFSGVMPVPYVASPSIQSTNDDETKD
jgi:hypothetical protein